MLEKEAHTENCARFYLDERERIIIMDTELEVGSTVPDFKLPSTTGSEIALSDYRGKKMVLFFVREYN
jgi:peroxiredoxin